MTLRIVAGIVIISVALVLTGCGKKKHFAPGPAPISPSNLTATPWEWNVIRLSWDDNSSNEDGFYVYRDTTGEYSKIARLVANSTSFDDTSVNFSSGITYWYKVTAYNENGESASSNEVSVLIPPGW